MIVDWTSLRSKTSEHAIAYTGCMQWTREQTYQTSRRRKGNADSMTCKQFAVLCSLSLIATIGCATCSSTNYCCPQQHCCDQYNEVCTAQPAPCHQTQGYQTQGYQTQGCQTQVGYQPAETIPPPTSEPTASSYQSSDSMIPAPIISPEASDPSQGHFLPANQLPRNMLPGAEGFMP